MNDRYLKEDAKHGTESYAYAQYRVHNLLYSFYMPYHWHDEVEIIYVKKGTLNVLIDNKEYMARAGDIYWVNPGQIHMMHTEDKSVEYYTILFSLELISFKQPDEVSVKYLNMLKQGKMQMINNINEYDEYAIVFQNIECMINTNEEESTFYKLDTKIKLLCILEIMLKNNANNSGIDIYGGKNQTLLRQIISYIDDNYTTKISLADIALEFHMSEKYFSRFFKNNFQMNFVEYVNRIRLEKASSLLISTDMSVTEVAMQCGYTNISYFIRSFKKAYGSSPHVFRKG